MPLKDAFDQFVRVLKSTSIQIVGHTVTFWEIFWYFAALGLLIWLIYRFLES